MWDLDTIKRRNEAAAAQCAKCLVRGEVSPVRRRTFRHPEIDAVQTVTFSVCSPCTSELVEQGFEVVKATLIDLAGVREARQPFSIERLTTEVLAERVDRLVALEDTVR